MGNFGSVGIATAGTLDILSPSIWSDCPGETLNEIGAGIYRAHRFAVNPTGTLAAAVNVGAALFGNAFMIDADTDTVLSNRADVQGGALTIETDGDDNDAAALYGPLIGKITKNSGLRLWFEAIVAPGDVDADMATFVGLVEADAIDGTTTTARDVIANDAGADGLVAESLFGFIQDNGDDNAYDAVYRLDGGTVGSVQTDVTNDTVLGTSAASLTDATFWKLGITFDGAETIRYYVNGEVVATLTVSSLTDQAKLLAPVIGIKTGTTAAEQISVRAAGYAAEWYAY